MDIMKKYVLIIITVLIVIISLIAYKVYDYRTTQNNIANNNKTYNSFYEKEVLGTDLATLINKAMDSNKKNSVEKSENGTYVDNSTNSVNIDIKFKDLDSPISMERIDELDSIRFVQNFGGFSFKCTKIEYHKKTGNVKYMYFEQL